MGTNKWGKAYWSDLLERVAATEIGALLTTSMLFGSTDLDWSNGKVVWITLGAPPAVAFLKGLLKNLAGGDQPSASLVGVTSTTD